MAVSDELYESLLTKGTIEGIVQLIDSQGKPIEQIQYERDFFTASDESSNKRRKNKGDKPHLSFSFNPGLETLFESIEEIKEGVKSALGNLDLEKELNLDKLSLDIDQNNSDKKIKKKKRERIKPTKDDS